jgi:hypothetical protein
MSLHDEFVAKSALIISRHMDAAIAESGEVAKEMGLECEISIDHSTNTRTRPIEKLPKAVADAVHKMTGLRV